MYSEKNHLFGLYVHWPYCLSKCPYCAFASRVCKTPDENALMDGYVRDISIMKSFVKENKLLSSIYFGGGTPSLMSVDFFRDLMAHIRRAFDVLPTAEITLEANPDAITHQKMNAFASVGVNRLSVGVQSLTQDGLELLGRRHTVQTALQRIHEAKQIFPIVNIDLIYARPNQTLNMWTDELDQALALKLKHYSLYQLSIDVGSVFYKKGVSAVDDETGRLFYEHTDNIMSQAGCPSYEVSNYAVPGYEGQHNMAYWTGADYLGIGPASAGRIGLLETQNPPQVATWLRDGGKTTLLSPFERMTEKIMTGLRLRHCPFPIQQLNPIGVSEAQKKGWIIQSGDTITPTLEGILMLDTLILMLLPEE